jgi:hypothetical protein
VYVNPPGGGSGVYNLPGYGYPPISYVPARTTQDSFDMNKMMGMMMVMKLMDGFGNAMNQDPRYAYAGAADPKAAMSYQSQLAMQNAVREELARQQMLAMQGSFMNSGGLPLQLPFPGAYA